MPRAYHAQRGCTYSGYGTDIFHSVRRLRFITVLAFRWETGQKVVVRLNTYYRTYNISWFPSKTFALLLTSEISSHAEGRQFGCCPQQHLLFHFTCTPWRATTVFPTRCIDTYYASASSASCMQSSLILKIPPTEYFFLIKKFCSQSSFLWAD